MALTGTLATFGDEETWRARYQQEVKNTLESGQGDILGINIPIALPTPELAGEQSEAVQDTLDNDGNLGILEESFYRIIETIDTILPPGPNAGISDPTFPIKSLIPNFIDILVSVGIPDPVEWILENLDAFVNDLPWSSLSKCENDKFADALVEIDSDINPDGLEERLSEVCGFDIPEISPNLNVEIPSLSFDFALPDLPTIEPFLVFNPVYPALNWLPIKFMEGIIAVMLDLISKIGELIIAFLQGIDEFLNTLINLVISAVLSAIESILSVLGGAILFSASIIALIKLSVVSFITAFVGFMINAGIIVFGVGAKLGIS